MLPPSNPSRRRLWLWAAIGLVLAAAGGGWWMFDSRSATGSSLVQADAAPDTSARGPFGLTRVHEIGLTISPEEWDALQETVVERGRGRGGGGFVAEGETDFINEQGRLVHRGGGFGGYFPWVRATLEFNGVVLPDIGLRYKGNSSYTSAQLQLRRNLKIKTGLHGGDATLDGVSTLNLHAGPLDPSRLRESLSYLAFRAAGVPAPRTAFAEVRLTVPGLYRNEFVGVHILIENVGKPFLREVLPPGTGLLLKPEGSTGGIVYLGPDWTAYPSIYRPERVATPAEQARVIEFARLVDGGSDEAFRAQIESFVDLDAFFRFVAVNALLVNLDSFLTGRHNYYLYLDPTDQRFRFIPWDQDLSLGSFGGGRGNDAADLRVLQPAPPQNRLIARLLAIPDYAQHYREVVEHLAAQLFDQDQLLGVTRELDELLSGSLAAERRAALARSEPAGRPNGFARGRPPLEFLPLRASNVRAQLDGQRPGFQPSGGGGGGRGGF